MVVFFRTISLQTAGATQITLINSTSKQLMGNLPVDLKSGRILWAETHENIIKRHFATLGPKQWLKGREIFCFQSETPECKWKQIASPWMPKKYVLKRKILETQIRCLKLVKILKTFKPINPRQSVPVTQHPHSVSESRFLFLLTEARKHTLHQS